MSKISTLAAVAALVISLGFASAASADSLGPDPVWAPTCSGTAGQWTNKGWVQWHPQHGNSTIAHCGTQCFNCACSDSPTPSRR